MSDLDSLLDATLDDLDDLPEFKPYVAGTHRVLATFSTKEINNKVVFALDFVYVDCIELADTQEAEPKQGDTAGAIFMMDNKWGSGNFKMCAAPFYEALGLSNNRQLLEQVQSIECAIVTSIRVDKNDPDKKYLDIKQIAL